MEEMKNEVIGEEMPVDKILHTDPEPAEETTAACEESITEIKTNEAETNETEAADKGNEAAEEKIENTDETTEAVIATAETKPVKEKKNKKKKGFIICLIFLLLAGCIGYFAYDQSKRNAAYQEALDKIELTVTKNTLEYADSDPVDPVTLVKSNGDVTADVAKIDVREIGKTKVVYTVETTDNYGKVATKTFDEEIEVIDTKAPVIELSDEEVSFYEGDDFTAKDHIASVKDPVDGDLELFESDGEPPTNKGWYTITSDVANDTAGSYTVKIHAEDKNGNKTDSEYAVTVNERPVAAEPSGNDAVYDAAPYSNASYSDSYSGGEYSYTDNSGAGYTDNSSDYSDTSYVEPAPEPSPDPAPEPAPDSVVEPEPEPVIDYSIPPGTFASVQEAYAYGEEKVIMDHRNGVENPPYGYYVDGYQTPAGVWYYVLTFKY